MSFDFYFNRKEDKNQGKLAACQRKVKMSGFVQSRNVRLSGRNAAPRACVSPSCRWVRGLAERSGVRPRTHRQLGCPFGIPVKINRYQRNIQIYPSETCPDFSVQPFFRHHFATAQATRYATASYLITPPIEAKAIIVRHRSLRMNAEYRAQIIAFQQPVNIHR